MAKPRVFRILCCAALLCAGARPAFAQLPAPAVNRSWSPIPMAPMPLPMAMAWMAAVQRPLSQMDLSSALPGIQDCLAQLTRLDFTSPNDMTALSPVLSALSESLDPRDFASEGTERQSKAIQKAVTDVAAKVRISAADLMLGVGSAEIAPGDAEDIAHKARSIQQYSMYLTRGQQDRVESIRSRAEDMLRAERARRTLALAEGTAEELEGSPLSKLADQRQEVVRTLLTPDGRTARLVRRGTVYQLFVEGELKPRARYDIADLESAESIAYPVKRDGRRAVIVAGEPWWEKESAAD